MPKVEKAIAAALAGQRLDAFLAHSLGDQNADRPLLDAAGDLTLRGFGTTITYSRKVFIPLTQLCRDVCHYCTFAKAPRKLKAPYLSLQEIVDVARSGASVGCKEALFTLGDKPELRYSAARAALARHGYRSTVDYLEAAARRVFEETGLLPHLNAGVLTREEMVRLRTVGVSMGLMLESSASRLGERGGPHFGSPDKIPAVRLEMLRTAGELSIPCTTGLLIGIGETRAERIDSLLALREIHENYGNLQELIIQNFRAKPGTPMAGAAEPSLAEHAWTIAAARLIFGAGMSIQAPPNLRPEGVEALVRAGLNDWGGVSPLTPDYVNPEAPWPSLVDLERLTVAAHRNLVERLALVPRYVQASRLWVDEALRPAVLRMSDGEGCARDVQWFAGTGAVPPEQGSQWVTRPRTSDAARRTPVTRVLVALERGRSVGEREIETLFSARGTDLNAVMAAADLRRSIVSGEAVTYVVNRNINYTNICLYRCGFCAFSKGGSARSMRGPAYNLDLDEIAGRAVEARESGATEVCLQGGIHPDFDGNTYLAIVAAVKAAVPDIHVHAFSPLEIMHGAGTLGMSLEAYLTRLKAAGLATLPGTAAEILDDEVRAEICPDKLTSKEWMEVMRVAHGVGLRSTATIMFGHVEGYRHWAGHLLRLVALQKQTRGFTEFVPLPFVHMEAPMARRGRSRSGPTLREALLMHAVARLVLGPWFANIQASWVKMGVEGAALCLRAGANDLGGTLMNESITRAAGGANGQALDIVQLEGIAKAAGRILKQRNTYYGPVDALPVVV